ncbi:MAG: DUF2804 domain-containing protein [Clostridia bacterium]|nr:DUF2804 domain-containing protein [Clostridia bacterium]
MNKQIEYTSPTKLLDENGNLLAKGWARRNVFDYKRSLVKPRFRLKEWDFHQIQDGRYKVLINFFNITVGTSAAASIRDIRTGELIAENVCIIPFTRNRFLPPEIGDRTNKLEFDACGIKMVYDTNLEEGYRHVTFESIYKDQPIKYDFWEEIPADHENITIVTPFPKKKNQFFLTTKQNCLPAEGYVQIGDKKIEFTKENSFGVMDWGRGVWPHKCHWYWGNGSTYLYDKDGNKHSFGFEITWLIGDTSNATETCLFYDGKAHKIGSVDVKDFPGKKGWLEPWEFTSEDGRFEMTMTPFYDDHSYFLNKDVLGTECHQAHGLWNGTVTLDDGTVLEIKDMYAFCEYVKNSW